MDDPQTTRAGGVGLLLAVVILATACIEPPRPALRIGANVWIGYEPFVLARHTGALPSDRFHILEYVSATQVLRGFRNGSLDLAAVTLDEALRVANGTDGAVVVAVLDVSSGADGIVARPEIAGESLVGRRVGVEGTAVGAYMLARWLAAKGLTTADIATVPLTIDEHEEAYAGGRVDALVTFEPVLGRVVRRGARLIFSSRDCPNEIVDVLVARRSVLRERADDIRDLLAIWHRTRLDMLAHPDRAAAAMAPRLGSPAQDVRASLQTLRFPSASESDTLVHGGGLRRTAAGLATVLRDHARLAVPETTIDALFDVARPSEDSSRR